MKLKLFIQVFIKLLQSEIKFTRSGPRPLICEQCLSIKDIFREECHKFIFKYSGESHNKHPKLQSSKEVTESFIVSLNKIICKLDRNDYNSNGINNTLGSEAQSPKMKTMILNEYMITTGSEEDQSMNNCARSRVKFPFPIDSSHPS